MGTHARLSPSAAHRWMQCPAAPDREATMPDESSVFAEEGTLAHAVAARRLKRMAGMDHSGEDAEIHALSGGYDMQEIEETVTEYVEAVTEAYRAARQIDPTAMLLVEQRLLLAPWIGDGYGTADALVCRDGVLEVFDLKYGRGVRVEARGNPQMRIYALGAAAHLFDWDVRRIVTHIVQPRLHHHDTETMTLRYLEAWNVAVLAPAVAATSLPGAQARAGGWCRFCRYRRCLTRARGAMSAVGAAQETTEISAGAMAADILPVLDEVRAWVTAMETEAMKMAVAGGIPGYKVVEGRGRRVLTDPQEVMRRLIDAGHDPDSVAPRTPAPLTALEKTVGKKQFAALCKDLIQRRCGAPRLVSADDPRPALSGAAGFDALDLDENEE